MKTRIFSSIFFASLFCLTSCEDKIPRFSVEDTRNVSEEALMDAYYQDMDDLVGVALEAPSDTEYNGGRTAGTIVINDLRFCNGVVVTIDPQGTVQQPQGVITIDFGTGCTDDTGIKRKGKLIITYNGQRFVTGSTTVTTTENYYVNDIKLEGTRTTTNITGSTSETPKFNVVLASGKATFSDNTSATRESDITASFIKGTTPMEGKLIIHTNSTANGVTRNGATYQVSVTKQIEFQRFCGMAVSGTKNYTINNGTTISIDYGTGTCDKMITFTINGFSRELTLD